MRGNYFFAVLFVVTLTVANATAAAAQLQPNHATSHRESVHSKKICGWFSNPSPQNMWLDDASTEWTISIQGEYEAKGDWAWPKFPAGQWVHTNGGDYGYGCACLRGVLNEETKYISRVYSVEARSLHMCRRNPALRAKEPPNPAA
jgi:hypothetical protein